MKRPEEITAKAKRIFSRIDFRRLSGVGSVLGIALEAGDAYVVELKRRGNPLDSLSGKIEAVNSFRSILNSDLEESGRVLKGSFSEFGITTRYAVISAKGARYVSAIIPPEIENTHEWVEENALRLLHLPVANSELVFNVDVIGRDGSGARVLITFFRRGEIENCLKFAESAGLELLSISSGVQDLLPLCALSEREGLPSAYRIAHLGPNTLTTLSCEGNWVLDVRSEHTSIELSLPDVVEKAIAGSVESDTRVFVSGAFEKSTSDNVLIRPFGLSSHYALAAGLALRGLLHRESGDFLPDDSRNSLDLNLARSLFKKTVLMSGLILLVALAIPLGASMYLNMKSDQLEESLASGGSSASKIDSMEKEVAVLKESLRNVASPESRSNTAYILHETAKLTPRTVRLLSLVLQADGPSLVLKGEGESERDISEFMKSFKVSPLFQDLSLKKLDTGGTASGESHGRRGRVYFELLVKLARGRGI